MNNMQGSFGSGYAFVHTLPPLRITKNEAPIRVGWAEYDVHLSPLRASLFPDDYMCDSSCTAM